MVEEKGNVYGRLTVLECVPIKQATGRIRKKWKCQCSCGNIVYCEGADLRRGHTQSCGCLQKERSRQVALIDLTGQTFGYLKVLKRDMQYQGHRSRTHWICECTACGTIKSISSYSLRKGKVVSCGCKKSKGELKICQLLNLYNIKYIQEYKFDDHKNRRYDFAILNKNNDIVRLIEFDGIQHYCRPRAKHWAATSSLEETQARDLEKNLIAQEKNIPLIRIPYWDLDKLTIKDLLINNNYLVGEKRQMASRGTKAKEEVVKKIAEAFGDAYLGEYQKKYYVKMRENGETVQVAIALTCPKTAVSDFTSLDFDNNELNFEDEDGNVIRPQSKTTEITPQEEENLRELLDKLGL